MKTLSKQITEKFFKDENGFELLQDQWKLLTNSDKKKLLKAEDFLLYQVLRGKDLSKSFTPITNANKLTNNGGDAYSGAWWAQLNLRVNLKLCYQNKEHMLPIYNLISTVGIKYIPAIVQISQEPPCYNDTCEIFNE